MRKNFIRKCPFLVFFTVLFFFLSSFPALAEPIAQPFEMNEQGIKLIKRTGKTPEQVRQETLAEIPTKASWHLPVYPGAKFANRLKGNDTMFPSLNLISDDPPDKIRKWYREHLKGWSFDDTYKIFHESQGELDMGKMYTTQTVNVMPTSTEAVDLMFADEPNLKTRIQIMYDPAKLNQ